MGPYSTSRPLHRQQHQPSRHEQRAAADPTLETLGGIPAGCKRKHPVTERAWPMDFSALMLSQHTAPNNCQDICMVKQVSLLE